MAVVTFYLIKFKGPKRPCAFFLLPFKLVRANIIFITCFFFACKRPPATIFEIPMAPRNEKAPVMTAISANWLAHLYGLGLSYTFLMAMVFCALAAAMAAACNLNFSIWFGIAHFPFVLFLLFVVHYT